MAKDPKEQALRCVVKLKAHFCEPCTKSVRDKIHRVAEGSLVHWVISRWDSRKSRKERGPVVSYKAAPRWRIYVVMIVGAPRLSQPLGSQVCERRHDLRESSTHEVTQPFKFLLRSYGKRLFHFIGKIAETVMKRRKPAGALDPSEIVQRPLSPVLINQHRRKVEVVGRLRRARDVLGIGHPRGARG